MRKTLLIPLLVVFTQSLSAQTWLPVGTKTHYESFIFSGRMVTTYTMIRHVNVQGRVCAEFSSSMMREESFTPGPGQPTQHQISGPEAGPSYRVCIEGRKYYYVNANNTFDLLADFSAKVGDSWTVSTGSTGGDCDTNQVKVFFAGDTVFDGREHHYLELGYSKPGEEQWYIRQVVVEGIGSMIYPFLVPPACYVACDFNFIRCFESPVESHSFVDEDCDIKSGISEWEFSRLKIYPNPVADQLTVSGLSAPQTFVLGDVNGGVVRQVDLQPGENTLQLGDLPGGVYWLKLPGSLVKGGKKIVKR